MSNSTPPKVNVSPMDKHNQKLVSYVHPLDWVNPQPVHCYDLVVIGAGTAGLVVAAGAAGLDVGLKVALIEKHLMGGDCLNVGCVPSKCMIRSSRVIGEIWGAKAFGIHPPERIEVDFAQVMERMRKVRSDISHHDSAARFQNFGVDVFLGNACFASQNTVEVGNQKLRFKKAVIATGARPVRPSIQGLAEAGFLTNETVFSLTELPQRLAVIGGGPIGCELAQTFQRLGSDVILFHKDSHILNKEDGEAAQIIQNTFIKEKIHLILNSQVKNVEKTSTGKVIHFVSNGSQTSITVDEIFVGVGRAPNVEGLNLEVVGVEYDHLQGVKVDDYLQTTNPKIYAAGDICMNWKFTHAADAAARIVIKNTFFSPFGWGRHKLSNLVMPWVTYTDPEIAHVGMYEHEAREQGIDVNTIKIPLSTVDRAMADGEEDGFVKIHYKKGADTILGATIVSRHAGETISELTTAIVNKVGLNKLSRVIHPYPTQSEAIKKAADTYRRTLLTPTSKRLLGLLTKFS
ncbi:mercuric reductase [Umezakia ovalisporum]|uniref:Mercuric reductase n=2 Tax=Umezakia ovalisporum TaxID=75695 RepID=A0AA43GZX4_9CYAN|nr:mercuric reductase [Umezakia ovalisporum]MBI1242110.1 FAD-containing oxidoreductase [Nostoc sp. RI_552]MDH6056858.1 mercuric reductase [Umezakia ovalisporum FSS-43]MDH6064585.1 mercuric reductase [Umezakia ovalisporum FSS-62]MDH6068677.1 mercuric reductase [Umezakia ovalisporum APH033B]MDH6069794.1 mercuric reductase [Umezakia ovalisporum CobakiLakeA]